MTAAPKRITVYLVDDQPMLRAAVRSLLSECDDFKVLGDSADARKAVMDIERLQPDTAVLDISMPELSGIEAIALIRKVHPSIKLVMLTHHESRTFVQLAMEAGAEGYVPKSSDPGELMMALRAVVRNEFYISPKVDRSLVSRRPTLDASSQSTDLLTPLE